MNEYDDLPRSEFAFPGPLRDRLVSAILDGSKTSTSSIAAEYEREDEPFTQVGARQVVVDSDKEAVAVIETTAVQHVRLALVPLAHARDEGRDIRRLLNGVMATNVSGTARKSGTSLEIRSLP